MIKYIMKAKCFLFILYVIILQNSTYAEVLQKITNTDSIYSNGIITHYTTIDRYIGYDCLYISKNSTHLSQIEADNPDTLREDILYGYRDHFTLLFQDKLYYLVPNSTLYFEIKGYWAYYEPSEPMREIQFTPGIRFDWNYSAYTIPNLNIINIPNSIHLGIQHTSTGDVKIPTKTIDSSRGYDIIYIGFSRYDYWHNNKYNNPESYHTFTVQFWKTYRHEYNIRDIDNIIGNGGIYISLYDKLDYLTILLNVGYEFKLKPLAQTRWYVQYSFPIPYLNKYVSNGNRIFIFVRSEGSRHSLLLDYGKYALLTSLGLNFSFNEFINN